MKTKKSDMAPLNRTCRTALEKILNDRYLRIFLWCLLKEDCRILAPFERPLLARDVGLRLLADAKEVSLAKVHQAEKDYESCLDSDEAWRNSNKTGDEQQWMEKI